MRWELFASCRFLQRSLGGACVCVCVCVYLGCFAGPREPLEGAVEMLQCAKLDPHRPPWRDWDERLQNCGNKREQ